MDNNIKYIAGPMVRCSIPCFTEYLIDYTEL